jgi:hypothetical protein
MLLKTLIFSLVDMEKILNEFERIYAHFILKETPSSNPDSVESVSFVLNLYKDSSEETSGAETKTIECCPVNVEVSVQGCVISKKRVSLRI